MLKKPSVLLSNYSNLHCLYSHQLAPINPSISSPKSRQSRYSHPRKPPSQRFATTCSDSHQGPSPRDPPWPDLPSPNAVPTPYQILSLKKTSPYSKRTFYELVKIYHPDKSVLGSGAPNTYVLAQSIKTERYRLIVTAHKILSDPVKRSAYDKSGAGWNGRPEHGAPKYKWGHDNDAKWSGFDTNDSPFRNATWEDWERWYQRGKTKQEPVYFSNGGFLLLVLTAVFFAGFGQSIRVGDYSNVFQRQVEKVHEDASMAIRQRRTESQGFGNRDERLQNFLRTRDPHGYGSSEFLQDSEMSMSEITHQKCHDQDSKS